jgi:hypothetical protein
MKKIGILACKMLQDEIIYLIQNDPKIQDIAVIEGHHTEFAEKLDKLNISYQLIPSIEMISDIDPAADHSHDTVSFIVWNLKFGLHDVPKFFKEEVYKSTELLAKKVNGICLFYGSCGSVLDNIEEDFKSICPLVILRDKDGYIADDCICATIGGRLAYRDFLKSLRGAATLIFTPMYSATAEEYFEGS